MLCYIVVCERSVKLNNYVECFTSDLIMAHPNFGWYNLVPRSFYGN